MLRDVTFTPRYAAASARSRNYRKQLKMYSREGYFTVTNLRECRQCIRRPTVNWLCCRAAQIKADMHVMRVLVIDGGLSSSASIAFLQIHR